MGRRSAGEFREEKPFFIITPTFSHPREKLSSTSPVTGAFSMKITGRTDSEHRSQSLDHSISPEAPFRSLHSDIWTLAATCHLHQSSHPEPAPCIRATNYKWQLF